MILVLVRKCLDYFQKVSADSLDGEINLPFVDVNHWVHWGVVEGKDGPKWSICSKGDHDALFSTILSEL